MMVTDKLTQKNNELNVKRCKATISLNVNKDILAKYCLTLSTRL